MLKAIALGIAAGAGLQAWRNFPPDGPVSSGGVLVVALVGMVCAWLAGYWRSRGRSVSATATATATATAGAQAQNTVNVVFAPGHGAASTGVTVPDETAPWILATERPMLTLDQVDGQEFSELIEETAEEAGRL